MTLFQSGIPGYVTFLLCGIEILSKIQIWFWDTLYFWFCEMGDSGLQRKSSSVLHSAFTFVNLFSVAALGRFLQWYFLTWCDVTSHAVVVVVCKPLWVVCHYLVHSKAIHLHEHYARNNSCLYRTEKWRGDENTLPKLLLFYFDALWRSCFWIHPQNPPKASTLLFVCFLFSPLN